MSDDRCGHCTHFSHGECWAAAMKMVHEADSERVDAVVELEKALDRVALLRGLLSEARGWIGDPSGYYGTNQADDFDKRAAAALEDA